MSNVRPDASARNYRLSPTAEPKTNIRSWDIIMCFDCDHEGNPLALYLAIPPLLVAVKTTFMENQFPSSSSHRHTHTGPNLSSTYTRWHTLGSDSQLLPDTIKHCEILAG